MKEEPYINRIRKNIKKYRTNQHLSQEELALLLGVNLSYIKKLEDTKRKMNISFSFLFKIARILHIPPQDFFKE